MLTRTSWKIILTLLVLTALTSWWALTIGVQHGLEIIVFDVGQGDSILAKRGNFEILIDGGPDGRVVQHLGRTLPPWDRTIEIVVLTHPHADHVAGLQAVLERYAVQEVWGTGVLYKSGAYQTFLETIRQKTIPYRVVMAGEHEEYEGLIVDVLAPLTSMSGQTLDNANLSSIVIKAQYGSWSMLLTGDAEEPIQRELLDANVELATTVLKIPHQGSRDALVENFLNRVRPHLAILSVGEKNRYGHPHQETLSLYQRVGIPILRTDTDGTITVQTDGKELWIRTTKTGIIEQLTLKR